MLQRRMMDPGAGAAFALVRDVSVFPSQDSMRANPLMCDSAAVMSMGACKLPG
jgi:hypothetical protein